MKLTHLVISSAIYCYHNYKIDLGFSQSILLLHIQQCFFTCTEQTAMNGRWDSTVNVVSRLCGNMGLVSWQGKRVCSSPKDPEVLWGPPNFIFNGHHGLFSQK